MRERLPQKRSHQIVEFEHQGITYRAGLGFFEDGRLAEVFIDAGKEGSGVNVAARDAAVVLSLALQSGCDTETIRHALVKLPDGSGSGPLGRLFDILRASRSQ